MENIGVIFLPSVEGENYQNMFTLKLVEPLEWKWPCSNVAQKERAFNKVLFFNKQRRKKIPDFRLNLRTC